MKRLKFYLSPKGFYGYIEDMKKANRLILAPTRTLDNKAGALGLYVHWPFCLKKCPYCDFNSHVRNVVNHNDWREAFEISLKNYASTIEKRPLASIFFGGGTPSLMEPETVSQIIDQANALFGFTRDIEITLEANPTSVEAGKFKAFKNAGVNRTSLGIQSLQENALGFLGREHSAKEALHALETAKSIFPRVSFDLIYARPEQTLKQWEQELSQALALAEGHISLYQLTIEKGTSFYRDYKRQRFDMPEETMAADFYQLTEDMTASKGLNAYEVSNYAKQGQESRHNLIYWQYDDYLGIGPGAHGRIHKNQNDSDSSLRVATREPASPENWLQKVRDTNGNSTFMEDISAADAFMEGVMMGLRLKSGVHLKKLAQKCGIDYDRVFKEILDHNKINALVEEGDLTFDSNHNVRLNLKGRMRLNAVLNYIIKEL